MTIATRLKEKDPLESVVVTFVFGGTNGELDAGETITNPVTVAVSAILGTDPTPSNILNGTAQISSDGTSVLVAITGGLNGVDYEIKVTAATSNPKKILTLAGIVPVRTF